MDQRETPHIDYALVEETRPPMYTAMKYWGKKPHNIWAEFIECYCPEGGIILDPFSGSAVAAFEAIKLSRRCIAFDLNPLTSFIIEALTSPFDENEFIQAFSTINDSVKEDTVYKKHYTKQIDGELGVIFNYRWVKNDVVNLAIEIPETDQKKAERVFVEADEVDKEKAAAISSIDIPYWFPTDPLPNSPSITHKFISDIGGEQFQYIWTRRNLYILARLFDEIIAYPNNAVRLQLLYGFIQTVHLCSKMIVPRSSASKREFSGSWGRADYMIRERQMEQNPLVVFRRSCIEKQSVLSAMRDAKQSLPDPLKVADYSRTKKVGKRTQLTYGTMDVADLSKNIPDKSIDFIITDPPYGGLVQYLDLSLVWLVWLQRFDKKYKPDVQSEITVKEGQVGREAYRKRLQNAFKQIHRVLKDDSYLVVTFHHKKMAEWNDFVHAIKIAGFKFDKVTHQYNKRSGESNVSNPYGTSGADFYIRLVKHREVDFSDDQSGLEHFIVQKTAEIIALRQEPTPYEFIIAGLLPELLQAGYMRPTEYQGEIQTVLVANANEGGIFEKQENGDNKAGDYWYFSNPADFINFPDRPLQDRVEETVLSILRRKRSVKFDDILSELFRAYPNGLTPDPKGIKGILEKHAYRASTYWKIKDGALKNISDHTEIIAQIVTIGKRSNYRVFVGKREQSEVVTQHTILRDVADVTTLAFLSDSYERDQIKRIEMIDVVWINESDEIVSIFEVENSTKFLSAIMRGSNIDKAIPKFMIIPTQREDELNNMRDPMFVESFIANSWHYSTYNAIKRLAKFSQPSILEMIKISKQL